MLDKLIFLVALAGTAVAFADVLVRPGMLLEPVQRWARNGWRTLAAKRIASVTSQAQAQNLWSGWLLDLDEQWWWKPLWGCYKCVAGQWGFWGYLIRYHAHYNPFEHFAFTAFTIIAAIIISKWTRE